MKKMLQIVSVIVLLLLSTACGRPPAAENNLNIATTAYALKYFIEKIGGSEVSIAFSFTGDPHHLELTQQDAQAIAESEALLNVAAGDYIDAETQLRKLNKNMKYFDVSKNIELLPSAETHNHETESAHGSYDTIEKQTDTALTQKKLFDPHIWLDPQRSSTLVANIVESLSALRPEKSEYFRQNAEVLQKNLAGLNKTFEQALAGKTNPYILVNHAAYGYLANRYHLEQKAIHDVSDHSENTQASVIALDNFVAQHNIRYVFIEPNTQVNDVMSILIAKYQLEKVTLYNLETPVQEETDYFTLMEQNAENLKKAVR